MDTPQHIESLLFAKGEPMTYTEIGKILELPVAEIQKQAQVLADSLSGRGITLVQTSTTITLKTAPESSEIVAKFQSESFGDSLGRAALETLSIILYKSPITRSEVEYIRGVSVSTSLRTLMMRGLVAQKPHPTDKRSFVYEPTVELLSHLGITDITTLPQYDAFVKELSALEETFKEQEIHG